jgi:hypothetical protein
MSPAIERLMRIHLVPLRLRACELCAHGCTTHGQLCSCPDFAREPSRDVHSLRAIGGACGPEAKHLLMPGVTTA